MVVMLMMLKTIQKGQVMLLVLINREEMVTKVMLMVITGRETDASEAKRRR